MTTPDRRRLLELAQLLRLRQLREDAARAERERCNRERDAAQAVVHAREREIEGLRADIAALGAFVAGEGAAQMARLNTYAAARRALLDDKLERAEYALIDDEETLAQADAALAEAQAGLVRAGRRRQAIERLLGDTRRAQAREREQRQERETEAPRPRQVNHLGAMA